MCDASTVSHSELETENDIAAQLSYPVIAKRLRPRLALLAGGNSEKTIELAGRMLIGSSAHVQICVEDRAVSRLHAELEVRDNGVWVRDIGSRNGTFVDGVRVESALLAEGSKLQCGGVTFHLSYAPEAATVDLWPSETFAGLLGRTVPMRELFMRASRFAASDAPVLIHGETGTGKELVAEAVHKTSARAGKPFVVVDCAALSESLLESELFGHARGAFTGALVARAGAFEAAEGGTVFLDEIGELPLALQPKLLRLLETSSVRRVGENSYRPVDLRFVSATHRDLAAMVGNGTFREDLYFRISVLPLWVPPLRARAGDIPLLVERWLGADAARLAPAQVEELSRHPWPGNVRELKGFVARSKAMGIDAALELLRGVDPPGVTTSRPAASLANVAPGPLIVDPALPYKTIRDRWIDQLERDYLAAQLAVHGRNPVELAAASGLDPTYVRRLLKKHGF